MRIPGGRRPTARPLPVLLVLAGVVGLWAGHRRLATLGSSFVSPPPAAGPATRITTGMLKTRAHGSAATAEAPTAAAEETAAYQERLRAAPVVKEPHFWEMVEGQEVSDVVITSWDEKQVVARLRDGNFVAVQEESEVEDLRDRLVMKGISIRYPEVDGLSVDEALEKANYTSESAVAGGILAAVAVGVADSLLELGGAVAITGVELEGQSFFEQKSPPEVIAEDVAALGKDLRYLERAAEGAERAAVADFQGVGGSLSDMLVSSWQWCQDVAHGLVANHAEGLGGLIEDSFMGLLVAVSLYSLYQMAFLKRKSNSLSGLAHTATGAMQIVTVVYAILEERCLRESPGPVWAVFTFAIFMVNNITMWPLLKYFKGTEVQRVLFKLAYSFIISFQGIHAIAWSIQYEWLYWVVMPFWFYSVKKLAESSDNIFALLPDGTVPIPGLQEAARRRVKGIQNDVPTIVYSALNFAGAVFDNLYMAVYTWRGPAGFWGWSAENIPGINDHLRTGLVKPAFGSLTISVLVFLGTLVYRRKLSVQTALALNVILASIGPWLILYYHKLVDFSEPWQPEIMGDWGSAPYLVEHFSDLGGFLVMPLAVLGLKSLGVGGALAPAVAEGLPEGLSDVAATTSSGGDQAVAAAAEGLSELPTDGR